MDQQQSVFVRDRIISVIAILLLGLLLRISFLSLYGGWDNKLYDSLYDQNIYIDIAQNLNKGYGFVTSTDVWIADAYTPTSIVSPVYPLFLAGIWSVLGYSLTSVRLIQILLSLITIFITYDLATRLFSPQVGLVAGILAAVNPVMLMYVRPIMTEALFIPILYIVIYLEYFIAKGTRRAGLYLLFGAFSALLCMIRNEAFVLIPLLVLYQAIIRKQNNQKYEWKKFIWSCLAVILVSVPYCYFNFQNQGEFSPSRNGKWAIWDFTWMAEMRNHPEWKDVPLPERTLIPDWDQKTETERDQYLFDVAINFIKENPKIFLIQRFKNIFAAYPIIPLEIIPPPIGNKGLVTRPDGADFSSTSLDDIVHYVSAAEKIRVVFFRNIFFLCIPGIVLVFSRHQWEQTLVIIPIFWNVLYTFLIFGKERYRIPADPLLIIMASLTIVEIVERLSLQNQQKAYVD